MDMTPVNSSVVDSVGYDEDARTISVRLNSGAEYHYPERSRQDYDALLSAPSVGSYWSRSFKSLPNRRVS